MNLNFFTGTAAELIKIYPVIHLALERGYKVRVLSSGQSRENFLMQYRDLGLPEDALKSLLVSEGDLDKASSALRWFLRAIFTGKKIFRAKLLLGEKTFVVVHGDTLSTLAGAWLGRRAGIPVVHIEAGLRSASLFNPFPEEISRRLVSRLASFHMAPDSLAAENLKRAGVSGKVICTNGNTLLDAVLLSAKFASSKMKMAGPFALVNIHRFENLNSMARWRTIVETVVKASDKIRLIFVQHPQTRHKLNQDQESLRTLTRPEIEIRDRMPFSEFIALLKDSQFLISDGGSNQEECSYLGKPCLLLRESTERQEGLGGCCVLSRFDQDVISRFLLNPQKYSRGTQNMASSPSALILNALNNPASFQ
ncbi:MAG: UDP-N-acetylglucosamine 2-epimerase [Bdellovibrionales bacterium]